MSEVNDAVQIVMMTGKGAYMVGKITIKTAMLFGKLFTTIYLAKWHGSVSVNRLRKIKGEDFAFINIGTEDKELLKGIEKEMKAHGLLYAKLPDLCGGDSRTQYVVPSSEAARLKAFLLDHANGTYKGIKVGPISPVDYMETGLNKQGMPTQEMEALFHMAPQIEGKEQLQLEDKKRFMPEIAYNVRKHDIDVTKNGRAVWIADAPIKTHDRWGMYQMPDGVHALIIPKQDMIEGYTLRGAGKVIPPQAAVCPGEMYRMVDLKSGRQEMVTGGEVILEFKKDSIRKQNEQLRARSSEKTKQELRQNRQPSAKAQRQTRPKAERQTIPKPGRQEKALPYTRVTIHSKMFWGVEGEDFVTRIPHQSNYVYIPKSDCRLYEFKSGEKILSAYIYRDRQYRVEGENGERYMLKGDKLRTAYHDKTRKDKRERNVTKPEPTKQLPGKDVKLYARNAKTKP